MWLQHPSFKECFSSWWREFEGNGWEGHKFMRKLQFVKAKLKDWNKNSFGMLKERKKTILDEIANIDVIEQEGVLSSDLSIQRIDRDCNSKLFHKVANGRRNRNFIKFLENERGLVLDNSESITEEILLYFKKLYLSPLGESWRVEDRDKASGPDGFTIAVFQNCWDVIKDDLVRVIAKVLSGRLRGVLHETIHFTQGAFVQGRQILDAVLIANEIVDEKRRSGEEGVKGFSSKWRIWMRGCLSSVSYAILVNGNAKGWVKASKGLRQGDPLSPFLFTIVADVLSRMLLKAKERSLLEGFRVGRNRCRVSHLQFADDTILFANSCAEELQTLKSLLLVFGQVFRLKVNLDKSNLMGINLDQNHLSRLALLLDCKASVWPILYLGLPLGGNPTTCGFWDPVIERISRRLDGWQKAYLSFGGRITLVQSCLSHIPSYFLSLFKISASMAAKVERMQRDFLWSGVGEGKRDHLVSWDAVCKPRVKGGLGFGKIPLRNRALLRKWLWRFPRKSTALWHQVILSIYEAHPNGDGERIRFWEDLWWGDQIFKDQYPRLFRVVMDKNIPISSILGFARPFSWNFNFRRNVSDSKIEDLECLMRSLDCMHLSTSASDVRSWSLLSSGLFTIKSFFTTLSQMSDSFPFFPTKFVWKSHVPFKVKAFVWLVAHKKVNTNDLLQLRRPHKALSPDICKLCMEQGESADHLFLHCSMLLGLWHRLFQLAKMDWVPPRNISDMMFINYKGFGKSKKGLVLWQNACIALIWVV
ncbi:putative ribonuclease H protein [Vitis vinifera]|uniref:Putative ribonuclease H protein n=1 Tax=Vitis vinifera TaxID=29760 RepID=A0A438CKR4_VITVI|nr:putative ribonuclease H protein [Vitis vinifera]